MLQDQACLLDGTRSDLAEGLPVSRLGRGEVTEPHPDIPERLQQLRHVVCLDRRHMTSRLEGTLVEPLRFTVRVDRLGVVACHARVAPRLVEVVGVEEVEREQLSLVPRAISRAPLDRLADPAVDLAAASVGKTLVGGVADEGVAEAEMAAFVLDQELAQPLPRFRCGSVRCERRVHEVLRKARPDHRGATEHPPVVGGQAVDLRHHQRLDGVRQPLQPAGLPSGGQQLGEKERIAARPLRQGLDLVGQERELLRRRVREGGGVGRAEGLELDHHRLLGGCKTGGLVASRGDDQPRPLLEPFRHLPEQVGGGVVHPVRVFEHEHGWLEQKHPEQLSGRLLETRLTELVAEQRGLRRVGELETEGHGQERQPGLEVRRARLHPEPQVPLDGVRVLLAHCAGEVAQQLAEGKVRCR